MSGSDLVKLILILHFPFSLFISLKIRSAWCLQDNIYLWFSEMRLKNATSRYLNYWNLILRIRVGQIQWMIKLMSTASGEGPFPIDNGWIQTLFLGILKSLNIRFLTAASESTSKMSHKLENMRSHDFRILRNFSI